MPGGAPLLSGAPTAATRVAAVIGDPVRHSLSPTLHNAAYRSLGLDWVYVALPVGAGHAAAAVGAMRTLGLAGLSVTMPHKAAAAAAVDRLSPTAARLGVVNTVTPRDGELHGDSTDGPGLLDALRAEHAWAPAGRRCLVVGAGGAARAVVLALAQAGAAEVVVTARRDEAARAAAELAGAAGRVGPAAEADGADLVVNATPAGMAGGPAPADLPAGLEPSRLGPGQLVVDLVYAPAVTPLLAAAAAAGAATAGGLGMLVHQAARQVAAWTGLGAPVAEMWAAATSATPG